MKNHEKRAKRSHFSGDAEWLRLIKRAEEGKGGIKEEDIKKYKIKMLQGGLDSPFLELISGSTGERHRRFIEFGTLQNIPTKGEFDTFGLSKTSTVPWF